MNYIFTVTGLRPNLHMNAFKRLRPVTETSNKIHTLQGMKNISRFLPKVFLLRGLHALRGITSYLRSKALLAIVELEHDTFLPSNMS